MRNILYIDVMNDCECSLVSRVNDGSNLLVLNIHVDVSKNPQLEINSKNIPLSVTDCVYVVPPALYAGTDSLQFRIIDNDHIGNYFSIIKVQSINGNLYIAQKSNFEYEFRTAKDNSFSFKIGDVTTLPAGEKPSVSNSGSDQHVVLDFAIPSGAAGIIVSSTEPTYKYTGMLWKCTGDVSGKVQNATYRWNGSSWDLYVLVAANIDVNDLFAQNITAKHMTIEGDSVFKGRLDGADGVFSGSMQAKKVYLGSTDLTHVSNGDLGLTSTTFTLDGENAIIQQYYDAEDGGAGGSYYDKAYIATIGGSLEGGPAHAQCELRSESYRRSEASGELRLGTSFIRVDPDVVKIYSDTDIDMSAETIVLNGTNWETFKSQHGYDWSTFGTADNTSTWMPVANGGRMYHRDVAATFKQAKYWNDGTNRWTCLRLSNDIVLLFVKATVTTKVDITSAAAKGYASREYTCDFPITIKTILYANSYVENNYNWENVELKIHSISPTAIKSHFWCQNSYKGLPLWWYYMLVAQM